MTRWMFALSIVLALAACNKQSPAPQQAASTPPPAATQAEGPGSVAPPGGGDIGVDPTGWSQAGNALTVTQSNDVFIPTGFTGSLSEIKFKSGPTSTSTASIQISFPSGAQLKVAPGNPANWQCAAAGQTTFVNCPAMVGNSISSQLTPTVNGTNSTITLANGSTVALSTGVSLTFK